MLDPKVYTISEKDNILSTFVLQMVPSALMQNILANFLIFIHAWIINHYCAKHKLSKELTLFGGVFYIIFVSLIPENNILSPILIANTFILLALTQLFKSYKISDATALVFNIGFFLGLATLFYMPYCIFIFFGIIALVVMRSFKVAEFLQYIIGFVLPFFLLNTYLYWIDVNPYNYAAWTFYYLKLPIFTFDLSNIFGFVLYGLSILVSFFFYGSFLSKKSIHAQKNIDVIFWLLLFCIISTFVNVPNDVLHFMCAALYLSFFIGILVSDSKNKVLFELIHVTVVIFIIISQLGIIA